MDRTISLLEIRLFVPELDESPVWLGALSSLPSRIYLDVFRTKKKNKDFFRVRWRSLTTSPLFEVHSRSRIIVIIII